MRRNVSFFAASAALCAVAGLLLRWVELNTLLDRVQMLMDFGAVSVLLPVVLALGLLGMALVARRWEISPLPGSYAPLFGGSGQLTVSVLSFLIMLAGAVMTLVRWQQSGGAGAVLAILAFLGGCGWLSLQLDAHRRKAGGCTLTAAAMPELFAALLLIVYYRENAAIPAFRYTIYPFLALCADLVALHRLAGFTVNRQRPRQALFLAGAGAVLSVASLPSVDRVEYRLFFVAMAAELFAHAIALLSYSGEAPEPADPAGEISDPAEEAPAPAEEAPNATDEAPEGC